MKKTLAQITLALVAFALIATAQSGKPVKLAAAPAASVVVTIPPGGYLAQDPVAIRFYDWNGNGTNDAVYLQFSLANAGNYVLQELNLDGFTWRDRIDLPWDNPNPGFWTVGDSIDERTGIKNHVFRLVFRPVTP